MFELGKLFAHKPDHPMNSVAAARDQLAAIDESKPVAALVDIGAWAHSLAGTDGFACDARFEVVAVVEAEGRRVAALVFVEYLRHIHKRDHEQRKIFEKFKRSGDAPLAGGHMGLGLYFCKRAMDAHQGSVMVTDTAGWPVSFLLRFPKD